jgi:hypothetical protein
MQKKQNPGEDKRETESSQPCRAPLAVRVGGLRMLAELKLP